MQPHTVTQSSTLSICNATQQPGAFKSGMQDAGFRFSVPVKDQSTVYYFCGVPTHCEKGMVSLPFYSCRTTRSQAVLTVKLSPRVPWSTVWSDQCEYPGNRTPAEQSFLRDQPLTPAHRPVQGAVALHPNDSFGTFMDQWGAM